ncbi:MAG: amidohydrolase, partial [Sphingomonas sp.]|nr:amidohydrolase [Sphingomonas sp.]
MKLSLIALTALLAASAATPVLADTLIDNANGVQVDAAGKLQRFTGLVIGDDGKVKRVLREGETRPAATARIDAGGKTMLPGLIDAHGHVMGLGFGALQLD